MKDQLARVFVIALSVCVVPAPSLAEEAPRRLSLADCIEIALEKNQKRQVSSHAVRVAKARYQQAVSSYWPEIGLSSAFTRMDDDPLFIFPQETSPYTISGVAPVLIQTIVTIPRKDVKLLDQTDFRSFVDLTFPLYTGGMRRGLVEQGKAGIAAAEASAQRTDLEVIRDLKRVYYGSVLAGKLARTGEEALARLEVTLDLTENLYKRGSGRVKKTDWLKHKVAVETLRSILAGIRGREEMALSALGNVMGVGWGSSVEPSETEVPFHPYEADLGELVSSAYRFSPDWARLKAGLKVANGRLKEAKSGWMPKVVLQGRLEYIRNSYDAGIVGPDQKKAWRAGVGMELPLFNGFRTRHQVREASARIDQLASQEILLREGIATQVKVLLAQMQRAVEQERAARDALEAATENRK